MPITVTFTCAGCFAVVPGTKPLYKVAQRSYGPGQYDTAASAAPTGWIAYDPYTGCCYCPTCWKEVVDHATV